MVHEGGLDKITQTTDITWRACNVPLFKAVYGVVSDSSELLLHPLFKDVEQHQCLFFKNDQCTKMVYRVGE